jgi:hypothetical protein
MVLLTLRCVLVVGVRAPEWRREVGWLVTIKGMESNEATGFLVLDSVLLV